MTSIIDIEGIGPAYAAKLKEIGINTVEALLEAGATPKDRMNSPKKQGSIKA